jgi:threonyl-tRNA synthetase
MNLEIIRHSLAHVLAYSIQELYPGVKFGTGPAIENGFYYDFELPKKINDQDLVKIEKRMKELISQNFKFTKKILTKKEAEKLFKDQPYKIELIKEKAGKNNKVKIYRSGEFIDLCQGPHIKSSKEISGNSFTLERIAGAYWKGNEDNKMLTRIYGLAFANQKELNRYLKLKKEAKERDHRKLGRELDLFCFSDLVGPGLPLFSPKGAFIKEALQGKIEKICRSYGFEKVITPHLAKIDLYEISGHAKKFKEELFHVSSEKGHQFVMKPVQCPHQTQIYASKTRSYRDLPIRYMESEKQYRAEKPGEVGGLNRVYAITVEDGHSFCTIEQVKEEIKIMVRIVKDFYKEFGLWGNHSISLSTRDKKHPEKYIGEEKDWNKCEKILKEVCQEMKLKAKENQGEAALYGPKIDFMFRDSLGKEVQIPTVQIDFATPKRFNLSYIDKDGKEKPPVMVHRAILGSYERFIALITEHFAGAFPFWLSPEQVWIISISNQQSKYAQKIAKELESLAGLRVKVKDENGTLSKKIREGETQKIPYLLIVGKEEEKEKSVSLRERGKGDRGKIKLETFISKLPKE